MKKTIIALLMSFSALHLMAQEVTFGKQLEQSVRFLHEQNILPETTLFETIDPAGFSDEQFYVIAAIMEQKDGYIQISRKSNSGLQITHDSFLLSEDMLSVLRYAGIEFRVSTRSVLSSKQFETY